jgi:hypothetical protein
LAAGPAEGDLEPTPEMPRAQSVPPERTAGVRGADEAPPTQSPHPAAVSGDAPPKKDRKAPPAKGERTGEPVKAEVPLESAAAAADSPDDGKRADQSVGAVEAEAAPPKRLPVLAIAGIALGVLVAVGAALLRDDETAPPVTTPTAAPTATATPTRTIERPTATATATAPSTVDPGSAGEHIRRFLEAMRAARNEDALGDLTKAAAADPTALDGPEPRSGVLDLLQRLSMLGSPRAPEAFELVGKKLGSLGPDLLLEIATTRGGTSATIHADRLLKDPHVLGLGTDAMRVAYDLRMARSCEQKLLLFQRAREVGDVRAQAELTRIRECHPNAGCCMRDNAALTVLIDAIGARIGWPSTAPLEVPTARPSTSSEPSAAPTAGTGTVPAAPTGPGTAPSPPASAAPTATATPDPYD